MIKNMLQAASKMMAGSKEEKVVCAKIIIDEIIQSLDPGINQDEFNDIFNNENPNPIAKKPEPKKPKEPKDSKEPKYKVMVDANRNLMEIEGLALDAKLEIDGKVVEHRDAIGKPFNSGKIL